MITSKVCPICNSSHLLSPAHKAFSPDVFQAKVSETETLLSAVSMYDQCLRCGVYFQNPRWTDEQVEEYYTSGAYRSQLKMSNDVQDKDEMERALVDADLIKNRLQFAPFSHLDAGAGRGYLLDKVGSKLPLAVELDRERIRNKDIYTYSNLEDVVEQVNLVTAIHVLEHVSHPVEFISRLRLCMRAGGRLVVEVPSDRSPGGWGRPAHLFHFPPWSLHYLMNLCDMELTDLVYTPHLFTIWKRKQDE